MSKQHPLGTCAVLNPGVSVATRYVSSRTDEAASLVNHEMASILGGSTDMFDSGLAPGRRSMSMRLADITA